MTKLAVQIDQITFAYAEASDAPIFQQISLEIPQGQWVSVIGANGSGKSTLVKLLNGLLPLQQGQIHINGMPLAHETLYDIRQQIGFIFQNPENQFIGTTVEEDMAFGLENLALPREEMQQRIHYYAEKLNITALLPRHPSELSGGQKQRAAIAAILAMEPSIVIFDEATSMLDEQARLQILQLMKDMHGSGQYTLISITHDADEIEASDRVIALAQGQILADEPPMSLFDQPEVMAKCHLIPSFYIRLAHQLQAQYQLPVHLHTDERSFMEDLCQLYSRK